MHFMLLLDSSILNFGCQIGGSGCNVKTAVQGIIVVTSITTFKDIMGTCQYLFGSVVNPLPVNGMQKTLQFARFLSAVLVYIITQGSLEDNREILLLH
jgi:hypothetical protein